MAGSRAVRRHRDDYNFVGDSETGLTFRWGRTLKEDATIAPWPELADISISNKCSKGCSFCYRNSNSDGRLMTLDEYRFVLDQLTSQHWGTVFQVAIGGGEPVEHPQLIKILKETRARGIVPNLTTNGTRLAEEQVNAFKQFCGAVAISISEIEPMSIQPTLLKLTQTNVRTNIHFILTRRSLPTAVDILKGVWDDLFENVNAIIFLTHKAVGRGRHDDNITYDENLRDFLSLLDHRMTSLRIGFDACFVPLLFSHTKCDKRLIDSCECGFFSVYIDEQMNVKPCSFTVGDEFSFNLSSSAFSTIWEEKFGSYREKTKSLCHLKCDFHAICRGGCLFHNSLNLCRN